MNIQFPMPPAIPKMHAQLQQSNSILSLFASGSDGLARLAQLQIEMNDIALRSAQALGLNEVA